MNILRHVLKEVKKHYDSYRAFYKDGVTHIFAVKGKETTIIVINKPTSTILIPP